MKRIFISAILSTPVATPAWAYDVTFTGRIAMIEPTYMPSQIIFKSDNGGGNCPAGALLSWTARGDTSADKIANTQAILAMLQTAKSTGGNVGLYVNSSNCAVEFIHFL